MICDFAETYHIYDIYQLPVEYAATLAAGLRSDSRIMLKVTGMKVDPKTLILARIADNTALNFYAKTKDARYGRNMPKSITEAMLEHNNNVKKAQEFASGEEFLAAWGKITKNGS